MKTILLVIFVSGFPPSGPYEFTGVENCRTAAMVAASLIPKGVVVCIDAAGDGIVSELIR